MVLVLFGVLVITFFLSRVVPADPIGAILGPQAPPDLVEKVRHEWGFDRPLYEQFIDYIWNVLHGDLGRSIRTSRSVVTDLLYYFPATIELATCSTIIAVAIGIPLGIISAIEKDKIPDHFARIFSILGVSTPVYWLGLVMLIVFYYQLGWAPGPGRLDPYVPFPPRITGLLLVDSLIAGRIDAFVNALQHILMPAFILGFAGCAQIARMTRSSMLEVMKKEYVRTARAKGLEEKVVITRHILKNALIPTVTVIGATYGGFLEGSVLTETIFSWNGLGQYATGSFIYVDFMAVMGVTLFVAVIYSLTNLVVDILYAYLDPRIRYG
jgi:peptide/nickel transport system permease protein